MILSEFSLRRFRAFEAEAVIPLAPLTVLIGPNNQGKSTILTALNLFVTSLATDALPPPDLEYDDSTDYPKSRAGRPGRKWPTKLMAKLALDDGDMRSFDEFYGGVMPRPPSEFKLAVELKSDEYGSAEAVWFSKELSDHPSAEDVTRWLGEYLSFVYVPATRGDTGMRSGSVRQLLSGAIESLSRRRRDSSVKRFYDDLVAQLRGIEGALADRVRHYLPSVRGVRFDIPHLDLRRLVDLRDILVDDGTETSLMYKGDGFKSLFALSLLQFIAEQRKGAALIFGIEEPESHLHPAAVYDVRTELRNLSRSSQVILSTHSPIMVQRDKMRSNVLVCNTTEAGVVCTAKPAQSLKQIRESLGVRRQDSMYTSPVMFVVEGGTEERCLLPLIVRAMPEIADAVNNGQVGILNAHGASKLAAIARMSARDVQALLILHDDDEPGRDARKTLLLEGYVDQLDIATVPPREGCRDTEFEDWFDPVVYCKAVADACGITLTVDELQSARTRSGSRLTRMKKWSDVMSEIVSSKGQVWPDVEQKAKAEFGAALSIAAEQGGLSPPSFIVNLAERVKAYLRSS